MERGFPLVHIIRQVRHLWRFRPPYTVTPATVPWTAFVLLHRYKGVLHAASDSIAERYGSSSGILALNLGPVWSNADAYKLFGDNVIEISFKEWESPPGLGICPLDVVFSVCYSISSWLNLNADHVVVSSEANVCVCSASP